MAKKTSKILAIFLINLIVFELILRALGGLLFYNQRGLMSSSTEVPAVLILGESTSVDGGVDYGSWPQELSKLLQQQNVKARVVNVAEPGTNTNFLLKDLNVYLQKERPRVVVSMMGINDSPSLHYKTMGILQNESFLLNLRILKLARLLISYIRTTSDSAYEIQPSTAASRDIELLKRRHLDNFPAALFPLLEKKQLVEAQAVINDYLNGKDDEYKAVFYSRLQIMVGDLHPLQPKDAKKISVEFFPLFEKSVSVAHFLTGYSTYLMFTAQMAGHPEICKALLQSYMQHGTEPSNSLMGRAFECLPETDSDLLAFKARFGEGLSASQQNEMPTAYNYLKAYEYLMANNICWVIMQYPLRDISERKKYFSDLQLQNPRLQFVENNLNFSTAVKQHGYDRIFIDKFGGDFGHTTPLGNRLLAESVQGAVAAALQNPLCGGIN